MSLIPDAASATSLAPAQGAAPLSASGASDFEMFLKMLTAQIRNQDPLEPMESADYAVQLATFSGVEQQVKTNDLLAGLAAGLGQGGLGQAAGWVGREVRAPLTAAFDGTPLALEFETRAGADAGVLVVSDAEGREVARHDTGAGPQRFDWGGTDAQGAPLPLGRYGFAIVSRSGGEEIGRDVVETYGLVREVRLGAEGAVLRLDGGGEVPMAAVSALRAAS
ncbi:flagellar hook capping FlgD N-terminal domain-containing protein [Limimaricola hongkongensis]|uniref:Basal-body rod modification protein FlgD n=1 Tax=Limimaricola hongkongensis DSM 17492 TaxID=1122180 RepID=A0A017HG79_9RHOB|nr:flagellar hook capping FlgD N-terminal domain-containing protein [Limimaricola hongkongensis]EYD73143.1 Flagellar basal-body rod modification protein FlgD [Limimaricola hongkongensis DSM 17492]